MPKSAKGIPMESVKWPQHSCKGDIGAFTRFLHFHEFEGPEGILHGMRLRRAVLENKDAPAAEKKPFGKLIKDYVTEHDPVKERVETYTRFENHDLTGIMKEMFNDSETGNKDRMSSDLVTLFSSFNITNPPEPQCMREKTISPEAAKMLDKAIADAALKLEIENINKIFLHQDRPEFPMKVSRTGLAKRVSERMKQKFLDLDGKIVLERLTQRMAEKGEGIGYNSKTHKELAKVIEEILSNDGHDKLGPRVKDATATLCTILGENVREEKSQGLNRTIALAALRKQMPSSAHEPCFGTGHKT